MARVVTLCTGNAARSVMLGFMFEALAESHDVDWEIRTAGTHVVEGQAMSPRTLEALERIDELGERSFTHHRSHQLSDDDVAWADVIVAIEADHVAYVRARHPEAREKTIQLRSFCLRAPLDGEFSDQVRSVAEHNPDDLLDVPDPAGKEQDAYNACAVELWDLAQVFCTVAFGES